MASLEHELAVAEAAVHAASVLAKQARTRQHEHAPDATPTSIHKPDNTIVTIVDYAAQAVLIATIRNAFPDDTFVGEEDAGALRQDPALRDKVWALVSAARDDADAAADAATDYLPRTPAEMMDVIDLGKSELGTRAPGRVWVMDPIDGTDSYTQDHQYVVALSLLRDQAEQLAVLGCPNLLIHPEHGSISEEAVDETGYGYRMLAVAGRGAYARRVRRPSDRLFRLPADLSAVPTASQSADIPGADLVRLAMQPDAAGPVRFVNWDSQALCLAATRRIAADLAGLWMHTPIWSSQLRYVAVAIGAVDALVRFYPNRTRKSNIHDHAGGRLLVVEAGGVVSDLDGSPLDFSCGRKLLNNFGFIISKPAVYPRLLDAVSRELAANPVLELSEGESE